MVIKTMGIVFMEFESEISREDGLSAKRHHRWDYHLDERDEHSFNQGAKVDMPFETRKRWETGQGRRSFFCWLASTVGY